MLVKTYWPTLFAVAYRRLGDEDLSKDLVQEVFTNCWQQRETIYIHTSVEAYFRTSLRNQLMIHFRKLDVESRAYKQLYQRMAEVKSQIKDTLAEKEFIKSISSEVEIMPTTMREIFKLRMEDYTIEEIAQSLNIADKTVKNNLSLGLHRLRKTIKEEFPEHFSAICILLYMLLI